MATNPITQVLAMSERQLVSGIVRIMRLVYLLLAVVFVGGVILQVFFAGAILLTGSEYLAQHRTFGAILAQLPFFILIVSLLARLPTRFVLLSVLLFVLYLMQFFIIHAFPSIGLPNSFRALHAVNALALFWTGLHLVRSTWRVLRTTHAS